MTRISLPGSILLAFGLVFPAAAQTLGREEGIMQASTAVLTEIMAIPARSIPQSLLAGAQGVAVIPNVIKGGFIIGARYGAGVLAIRDNNGHWQAPVFITLTGGNVGFQAGVQATDVVLVFKTRQSVQRILGGKFTLGADAAAAAGPVGRQASAGTDLQLKAEIYSYSRSRGLFAGVSIDGSVLKTDGFANAAYYQNPTPGQPVNLPPSAGRLVAQLIAYTGGAAPTTVPAPVPSAAGPVQAPMVVATGSQADQIRDQLASTAPQLFTLLDDPWKQYLALPAEVFTGKGHASLELLQQSVERFDAVAHNPQYQALAERPVFQSTYGLLKQYQSALAQGGRALQIPPPPAATRPAGA